MKCSNLTYFLMSPSHSSIHPEYNLNYIKLKCTQTHVSRQKETIESSFPLLTLHSQSKASLPASLQQIQESCNQDTN